MKCDKPDTDRVWTELLLAAIGEQFDSCLAESDEICGVSVSTRDRDDVLQLWNKKAAGFKPQALENKIRDLLPSVKLRFFYSAHNEH